MLVPASWVDSASSSYQHSGLRYTPESDDGTSIIGGKEIVTEISANIDELAGDADSVQDSLDNTDTTMEGSEQPSDHRSANENEDAGSTSGSSEVRDHTVRSTSSFDIDDAASMIRVLNKRLGKLRERVPNSAFDDPLNETGCRFCACFAPLVVHIGSTHKPSIRTWAEFRDACDPATLADNAGEIPIRYIEKTVSVLKSLPLEDTGMTKDEMKELKHLINLYKSRIPEYRKGRPSRVESLSTGGNRRLKKKRTDTAYNPTGHMYHHISRTLKMKTKMKKERC